jgi:hypothetical protein
MDDAKIAEPLRQVAPGNARAITIEHGFHEQPIIFRRHAERAGA